MLIYTIFITSPTTYIYTFLLIRFSTKIITLYITSLTEYQKLLTLEKATLAKYLESIVLINDIRKKLCIEESILSILS